MGDPKNSTHIQPIAVIPNPLAGKDLSQVVETSDDNRVEKQDNISRITPEQNIHDKYDDNKEIRERTITEENINLSVSILNKLSASEYEINHILNKNGKFNKDYIIKKVNTHSTNINKNIKELIFSLSETKTKTKEDDISKNENIKKLLEHFDKIEKIQNNNSSTIMSKFLGNKKKHITLLYNLKIEVLFVNSLLSQYIKLQNITPSDKENKPIITATPEHTQNTTIQKKHETQQIGAFDKINTNELKSEIIKSIILADPITKTDIEKMLSLDNIANNLAIDFMNQLVKFSDIDAEIDTNKIKELANIKNSFESEFLCKYEANKDSVDISTRIRKIDNGLAVVDKLKKYISTLESQIEIKKSSPPTIVKSNLNIKQNSFTDVTIKQIVSSYNKTKGINRNELIININDYMKTQVEKFKPMNSAIESMITWTEICTANTDYSKVTNIFSLLNLLNSNANMNMDMDMDMDNNELENFIKQADQTLAKLNKFRYDNSAFNYISGLTPEPATQHDYMIKLLLTSVLKNNENDILNTDLEYLNNFNTYLRSYLAIKKNKHTEDITLDDTYKQFQKLADPIFNNAEKTLSKIQTYDEIKSFATSYSENLIFNGKQQKLTNQKEQIETLKATNHFNIIEGTNEYSNASDGQDTLNNISKKIDQIKSEDKDERLDLVRDIIKTHIMNNIIPSIASSFNSNVAEMGIYLSEFVGIKSSKSAQNTRDEYYNKIEDQINIILGKYATVKILVDGDNFTFTIVPSQKNEEEALNAMLKRASDKNLTKSDQFKTLISELQTKGLVKDTESTAIEFIPYSNNKIQEKSTHLKQAINKIEEGVKSYDKNKEQLDRKIKLANDEDEKSLEIESINTKTCNRLKEEKIVATNRAIEKHNNLQIYQKLNKGFRHYIPAPLDKLLVYIGLYEGIESEKKGTSISANDNRKIQVLNKARTNLEDLKNKNLFTKSEGLNKAFIDIAISTSQETIPFSKGIDILKSIESTLYITSKSNFHNLSNDTIAKNDNIELPIDILTKTKIKLETHLSLLKKTLIKSNSIKDRIKSLENNITKINTALHLLQIVNTITTRKENANEIINKAIKEIEEITPIKSNDIDNNFQLNIKNALNTCIQNTESTDETINIHDRHEKYLKAADSCKKTIMEGQAIIRISNNFDSDEFTKTRNELSQKLKELQIALEKNTETNKYNKEDGISNALLNISGPQLKSLNLQKQLENMLVKACMKSNAKNIKISTYYEYKKFIEIAKKRQETLNNLRTGDVQLDQILDENFIVTNNKHIESKIKTITDISDQDFKTITKLLNSYRIHLQNIIQEDLNNNTSIKSGDISVSEKISNSFLSPYFIVTKNKIKINDDKTYLNNTNIFDINEFIQQANKEITDNNILKNIHIKTLNSMNKEMPDTFTKTKKGTIFLDNKKPLLSEAINELYPLWYKKPPITQIVYSKKRQYLLSCISNTMNALIAPEKKLSPKSQKRLKILSASYDLMKQLPLSSDNFTEEANKILTEMLEQYNKLIPLLNPSSDLKKELDIIDKLTFF